MDIEQLSKSQTVLLTLLVSFVTSIATGIVTVSLMDQAPPSIAQTVNRVIERTVQQVVSPDQSAAAAVTQEKTVVVRETDLVAQAVARVSPSIVRVYSTDAENPTFLGLGVVLNASGTIAIDGSVIGDSASAVVTLSDSARIPASFISRDDTTGVSYLASATSTTEGKPVSWKPISVSMQNPVLGESIVSLAGKTVGRIANGIITSVIPPADEKSSVVIDTDIPEASITPGSPLIDTDGNLVGLSTSLVRQTSASGFASASVLLKSPTDASEPKGGSQ